MSLAIMARLGALESRIKVLEAKLAAPPPPQVQTRNPQGPRKLCPVCGEVPAYYLHVKNCKGKKQ